MNVKESIVDLILDNDPNYGVIAACEVANMIIKEYKETGNFVYNVKNVNNQELEITLRSK